MSWCFTSSLEEGIVLSDERDGDETNTKLVKRVRAIPDNDEAVQIQFTNAPSMIASLGEFLAEAATPWQELEDFLDDPTGFAEAFYRISKIAPTPDPFELQDDNEVDTVEEEVLDDPRDDVLGFYTTVHKMRDSHPQIKTGDNDSESVENAPPLKKKRGKKKPKKGGGDEANEGGKMKPIKGGKEEAEGKEVRVGVEKPGIYDTMFGGEEVKETASFVYLGSVVDRQGGTDRDVIARIGKARAAFIMLRKVWASRGIRRATKLRIFNSNIKLGGGTGSVTRSCGAGQDKNQLVARSSGGNGHGLAIPLRKPSSSVTQQALTWNPQGKRKRGRSRNSWRRDTEDEMKSISSSWQDLKKKAQRRVQWRSIIGGLCPGRGEGPK
ncbi:Hypp6129 [Branchiostoma lanceolatum]|uniref:Hypp6129 protein n=1 Tax=Branchiostoma lanceolatum TaxID=7740 RepID=A0A8J9W0U2_BRALA|nr:Hypp6129 [Branchiostoma lanceolatum]